MGETTSLTDAVASDPRSAPPPNRTGLAPPRERTHE